MALISYTSEEQSDNQLNNGTIFEKKPVGFPEDEGLLKAYSNIFYWTHMWTEKGGEIAEHSHKGFDIITFVLKGEVEHYDSKYKGWRKLTAGDVQVVRAGNGFVHSEKLLPGSSILQIWTDPNLEKSLNQPASCHDYASDRFPIIIEEGKSTKVYTGADSPLVMQATDILIKELSLAEGSHFYECSREVFVSGFILEGEVMIRKHRLNLFDFFIAKEEEGLHIRADTDCRLFIVESPLEPGYATYAENYSL